MVDLRILSVALALTLFGAPRVVADGTSVVQPIIRSIRVHAFDKKTGKLGQEDLITASSGGRWNDVTSSALFVVLEISGPAFQEYARRGRNAYGARLIAKERTTSKLLHNETRPVVRLSENGLLFVSFLIQFDSCSSVDFTAKIVDRDAGASTDASVFFNCGE